MNPAQSANRCPGRFRKPQTDDLSSDSPRSQTPIAAFEQLEIQFKLLEQVILIAFGALGIGTGLTLGLGGRDVVGGILAGYYVRQRMQAGDQVSVAGLEGTVRDVGPVATVIEVDNQGITDRHSVPNTRMLNEAVR